MLDRNRLRQDPEGVRAAIRRKGVEPPIDEFLRVDEAWRSATHRLQTLQAESNRISKSIGQLMASGQKEEAEAAKAQTAVLKSETKELEALERSLESELKQIELQFANTPHPSVPDGKDEKDNVVIRTWGEKPTFAEPPHASWDIAAEHDLIDFERGTKITGSGFPVYKGFGAKLQRALISYFLDIQTSQNGYDEVYPPALVNADSLIGTGNLPKFEDDLYKTADGFYLIPTAEVPVTNLYRDEILDGTNLPICHAAYTPCFRREAGAAGRDTRGILRVHQFDKVELVRFELPENSYTALEEMTGHAEAILQGLGLHYRVIELCTGDMGEKGCKTYDIEVYAPAEDRWLEVSSCTNFEDYQARRANIRFRRDAGSAPEFVHILNGSGLAVPRVYAALLECCRLSNGDLVFPEALHPYLGTTVLSPP